LLCDDTAVASNSREVAKSSEVSPDDEPSAEWGWHGTFPRAKIIAGVVCSLILIAFLFGPYQSRTQDLWLVGTVLVLVFMIWRQVVARRNAWRR
jgi:hypothetical protein